ncbi:MAG TPA: B12-binding domain-containing radical SAM protein [Candidatus Omnitrophota bacterium]|nr:B12-binding domain-containing radical SAM protein [Candidatus Omnitrophota bacterium]
MAGKLLLINPWIYDFAAYDFWLKPWGFIKIAGILKRSGWDVTFIDTLDRGHPSVKNDAKTSRNGTGKFHSENILKPVVLKRIPRKYKRYGIPLAVLKGLLPEQKFDYILVSSGMTYWYPGVFDMIRILREKYGGTRIILGGTYASLCYDHAVKKSGADEVIHTKNLSKLSDALGCGIDLSPGTVLDENADYGLYNDPVYAVLRISLGCPYDCVYCAQKQISPPFMLKNMNRALEEISELYEKGIRKFAFYDDALLFDQAYIKEYLSNIIDINIKAEFYTPNGLHARFISKDVARMMKGSGFVSPIVSLETVSRDKENTWHSKVTKEEYTEAVNNLKEAGYKKGEFSTYLLLGAPGSSLIEVKEAVDFVHSQGGMVSLSEFSPVPGTAMADRYIKEIMDEPLFHNNSVFPNFSMTDWPDINRLKLYARGLNSGF